LTHEIVARTASSKTVVPVSHDDVVLHTRPCRETALTVPKNMVLVVMTST